jgi:dienelactone hydrolase
VLWAHGFRGFGTEVSTENPGFALRRTLIDQGYAWGASSYSENGYAPGIGADDTLALKQYFAGQFGTPKRTYIAGASMGGNVVSLSLEYFPGEYDGGLAVCGALTGEEEIDYLVSWAMLAEFTSGVTLPLGEGQARVTTALLTGVSPALGPVESPTTKGKAFANTVMNLTGGPRPFFSEGFKDQFIVNFGLVAADPDRTTLTARASTNEGAVYHIDSGLGFSDDQLNSGVRRLAADAAVRVASVYPDKVPTTGRIGNPLLTLHNTGDLFVPISVEQGYRKKTDAAGKGDLLVQRIIRDGGHCKFSDAEATQAWNDLVRWVTTGTKPVGDNVLGDLADAGRAFTNPLRPNDPGNK